MHLSRAGYYADFWIFPLLLIPLGMVFWRGTAQQQFLWLFTCIGGIVGWTLLEYVMHRALFHRIQPFRHMHELHHAAPTAMVGTPTLLSAAVIGGGVLVPLWQLTDLNTSCGITFGFVLGYLWYGVVHHAIHHWHTDAGSYLHRAKLYHGRHHRARRACNFGVTTAFWDRLFGTAQVMKIPSSIGR